MTWMNTGRSQMPGSSTWRTRAVLPRSGKNPALQQSGVRLWTWSRSTGSPSFSLAHRHPIRVTSLRVWFWMSAFNCVYIYVYAYIVHVYMKSSFPKRDESHSRKWACNDNDKFKGCVLVKSFSCLWRALLKNMTSDVGIFGLALNAFWKRAIHMLYKPLFEYNKLPSVP